MICFLCVRLNDLRAILSGLGHAVQGVAQMGGVDRPPVHSRFNNLKLLF